MSIIYHIPAMCFLIIDGSNVPLSRSDLCQLTRDLQIPGVIVFDGKKRQNLSEFSNMTIFSGARTADDVIVEELVVPNDKNLVLVTDDKLLRRRMAKRVPNLFVMPCFVFRRLAQEISKWHSEHLKPSLC
jgi:hypothetical protein